MSSTYSIELPWPPRTGNTSTRRGQGRMYTQKSIVSWRQRVALACSQQGVARKRLPGPMELVLVAFPPDRRARDGDNLAKVVKDALTRAQVWVDDSNAVIRQETVRWGDVVPGGALCVELVVLGQCGNAEQDCSAQGLHLNGAFSVKGDKNGV